MLALYFTVGRERLTVPASFVIEVLPAVELQPARPNPNGIVVLGLLRHRGRVVPLVDPTGQASVWEPRLSRRIIVVEASLPGESVPRRIGLSADRVLDLRPIMTNALHAASDEASSFDAAFADEEGIVRRIDVVDWVRRVHHAEAE